MPRAFTPQVAGIYQSNMERDDEFMYLLLEVSNPNSEYWATDAFPCTAFGAKMEGWKDGAIVATAADFGDCVKVVTPKQVFI